MYCYGVFGAIKANSQSQNQSTLKTQNTFSATAPAPTNPANMMRATKVDSKPPQARNAALIAKRAQCIPLQCQHTGLPNCPVCVAKFYWSLWATSQTFAALVSKSGFLQRGPPTPEGGHGAVLWGPWEEAEAKTRYFIDEQGATSVESPLKGEAAHESLRTTVKWCWQVLQADPAIRGRATRQFPPKFSKTCSVVSLVEYISWVRPCLLSKIKL